MKPIFVDTHSHINFNVFKKEAVNLMEKCLKNEIWLLNVGTEFNTSKIAIDYANKFKQGIYATVGLHPLYVNTGVVELKIDKNEFDSKESDLIFDYKKFKEIASKEKVVAIGEIGLDYWYKPKTTAKKEVFKQKQKEVFIQQLDLAKELNLPIIIHCRLAFADVFDVLKNYENLRGVFHCFTGNLEEAKKILDMGFYLGFNGIIFKKDLSEIIKNTPLNRILLETDCPYLCPLKSNRNTPLNLKYICEKIAEIKNVSFDKIAEKTTNNATELFNLK
ncbi:MAG: TatD family hydrolase [bacterium]|nr:TatD family hydrolase [bacterium]